MLMIFVLGAVFGALVGAFALALYTTTAECRREQYWRRNLPPPARTPGRHATPEDRRPPMNTRGQ